MVANHVQFSPFGRYDGLAGAQHVQEEHQHRRQDHYSVQSNDLNSESHLRDKEQAQGAAADKDHGEAQAPTADRLEGSQVKDVDIQGMVLQPGEEPHAGE